jgi:hypothetical protein
MFLFSFSCLFVIICNVISYSWIFSVNAHVGLFNKCKVRNKTVVLYKIKVFYINWRTMQRFFPVMLPRSCCFPLNELSVFNELNHFINVIPAGSMRDTVFVK